MLSILYVKHRGVPNISWRRRILAQIFTPVSQMHIIRKATCCDLLTWGPLQVWHRKVGQWEEAETCRVTDCMYLLKFAPQWNFLLYLKFLWRTIYPATFLLQYLQHFYFNIHNISTSTSSTFILQYPLPFCFNIRYISASISATVLLQYLLHFYFNIRYPSASVSATFLLQYLLHFYFNIRNISTSTSSTFILQYPLHFCFNILYLSTRFISLPCIRHFLNTTYIWTLLWRCPVFLPYNQFSTFCC